MYTRNLNKYTIIHVLSEIWRDYWSRMFKISTIIYTPEHAENKIQYISTGNETIDAIQW
jgi:hypothetical protein